MYSNKLLDEKYKSQKELFTLAEKEQKKYLKLIEEEVLELFQKNAWNLKYSKRKGGYLEQNIPY